MSLPIENSFAVVCSAALGGALLGVASLRACVLLRKQREQAMSTKCEMVGFDIPDVFVVGYGLDFNDEFRNMPFVGVLGEDGIRERSPR